MLTVRLHRAPVAPATPAYEQELDRLLRLAQEGFYWQGEVEDLLIAIRDDGDLADLSRAGGPIVSRFEALTAPPGAPVAELAVVHRAPVAVPRTAVRAWRGRGPAIA